MVDVVKIENELAQINGRGYKYTKVDLGRYTDEQICRQAVIGNKAFINELIRRADSLELEGEYMIANALYKMFTQGLL